MSVSKNVSEGRSAQTVKTSRAMFRGCSGVISDSLEGSDGIFLARSLLGSKRNRGLGWTSRQGSACLVLPLPRAEV